jgi:formyl-CoA transferase
MLAKIDYGGNLGVLPVPGLVPKLSKTPGKIDKPCPFPGQDNQDIYGKLLGYDSTHLEELAGEGVI